MVCTLPPSRHPCAAFLEDCFLTIDEGARLFTGGFCKASSAAGGRLATWNAQGLLAPVGQTHMTGGRHAAKFGALRKVLKRGDIVAIQEARGGPACGIELMRAMGGSHYIFQSGLRGRNAGGG